LYENTIINVRSIDVEKGINELSASFEELYAVVVQARDF
jgi:hypothetical protein